MSRLRDPENNLPSFVRDIATEIGLDDDPGYVDISWAEKHAADEARAKLRSKLRRTVTDECPTVGTFMISEIIGRPLDALEVAGKRSRWRTTPYC